MKNPDERDEPAGSTEAAQDTEPELEDAVHEVREHTAALAKEAAASAGAAAMLAKVAGTGVWKVLSALSGPVETVSTAAKATTSVTPMPSIVDAGVRQVKRVSGPVLNRRAKNPLGEGSTEDLKRRGNRLIGISHRAEFQPRDVHPAFSRILDELTPDEARILRFLAVAGPQPVIDVRTKTLFQMGSEQLAEGISMVTQMAGCRYQDRDLHYFSNLNRLGLMYYSMEPVDDYRRYSLIEVQPRAVHAIEKAKKAITLYRSVALTAFGRQFVATCIDIEGYDAGGWDTNDRGDKIAGKGPPDQRARKKAH